jgi:hypothetical protein
MSYNIDRPACAMVQEDAKLVMKYLDTGHVEATGYHKYWLVKERRWVSNS